MINLVHNSIKFSQANDTVFVVIDQFVVSDPQNFIGVNIRVRDQGMGISEEDKKNLFQMYF